MDAIKTFVFFDLETTGFPAHRAKVTEITLLAVSRRDVEQADGENLPAANKLSLLCNPRKEIQPAAAKITGLTNQFLKNLPDFKDNIKCINAFLDKPKPVCLVAHNGNRFDFKILKAEYQTANEELPHDLLCLDSLKAFRHILKVPKKSSNNTVHNNSINNLNESNGALENGEDWQDLSIEEIQEIDGWLEEHFSEYSISPTNVKKIAKTSKSATPKEEKLPKVSYTLCNLYENLLDKKATECHRAEADCVMLLECAIATKQEFLDYADREKQLINQI